MLGFPHPVYAHGERDGVDATQEREKSSPEEKKCAPANRCPPFFACFNFVGICPFSGTFPSFAIPEKAAPFQSEVERVIVGFSIVMQRSLFPFFVVSAPCPPADAADASLAFCFISHDERRSRERGENRCCAGCRKPAALLPHSAFHTFHISEFRREKKFEKQ